MSSGSSESPRKKSRHVCLICGSYTTLMINIYEPRSGPNIVDVINQKFGMQPLNDDKFLICYSCNNWLVNWHSLQNKNEASSSKGSKKTRFNQSIPEEHQHEETMAVLVDQCSDVLRLRSKLSKYLYYPKTTNLNYADSAILISKCDSLSHENRVKAARKKIRSFRFHVINKKYFGHHHRNHHRHHHQHHRHHHHHPQRKQTKFRAYVNKSSNTFRLRLTKRTASSLLSHNQRRIVGHSHHHRYRSSQTIVVNPYVVSRLKQLGTTVMCEGTSATAANDLTRRRCCCCSITKREKKIDQSVIQSNANNDIVIAFDTVLQEVFPVDLSEEKDVVAVDDISKIFERIPKSLSITLA